MKTIHFESLSLRDALDLAILIEEEAAERYEELAAQMDAHHTAGASKFFRVMVQNESRHRDELATRRKLLFGDEKSVVERSMLWEVEAPEYDKVRAFMTERAALNVALQSEEKAYRFFVEALPHVTDAAAKKLFEELCAEEVHHQELVCAELAKLPDEALTEEDLADEPVAQ